MSSPRLLARMAALFLLLTILAGLFAQGFISGRLINFNDAAATATNILTNRGLFQLGFTVFLIEMACQVTATVIFYQLLKPVNRTVALVALCLELTACIIKTFARVFYIAPLFVLTRPLAGFSTEQLQGLALILLRVNNSGAGAALAFFGISVPLRGYLVFRSTFLPRWLGVLSAVAGLGWLTFLYPPLGSFAFPVAAAFALLSSAVMIFWLFVFGVNEERWMKQNRAET